jgi:hypothetical protein
MATTLPQKLAKAVVDDLFSRMGRSEGERMGDMLGVMMLDPGLRVFQAEMAVAFDRLIKGGKKAPAKRRGGTRSVPKKSKPARKRSSK